jgi:hypothetical protein
MRHDRVAVATIVTLLLCTPAFAESSTQSIPPFGGCIGILVIYFCVKRRTQEIGGWLLYFYIQLYVALIAEVAVVITGLENYIPGSWAAAPGLYWWFLASTMPAQVSTVAQLILAETLRRSRDATWLAWLRAAFWLDLVFVGLALAIDAKLFRDNLALDGMALLWPMIWLPYLYISKRVKRVFVLKDWVTPPAALGLGLAPGGPTKG